jgi:hypothetical protein
VHATVNMQRPSICTTKHNSHVLHHHGQGHAVCAHYRKHAATKHLHNKVQQSHAPSIFHERWQNNSIFNSVIGVPLSYKPKCITNCNLPPIIFIMISLQSVIIGISLSYKPKCITNCNLSPIIFIMI